MKHGHRNIIGIDCAHNPVTQTCI